MSAAQKISLIGRKARSGRELQAARAMSLGRALRLTAAKQADRLMGLALNMLGVTRSTVAADALPDLLPAASLILLMDGPGRQVCAAVLDPQLVAGLIQQQTMGKVTQPRDGEEPRPHTSTDAALCAPFIEALLGGAAAMPEDAADRDLLQGYRFGVRAEGPRAALLALDQLDYQIVTMTFDMAGGARSGTLSLILPNPSLVASAEPDEQGQGDTASRAHKQNLSKNVMQLKAELTVALTRLSLPLQAVTALKAGDVVDLKLSSLAQALVIDGSGKLISRGTLGQIDGMRAVQVEQQKDAMIHPRRRASDRDDLDLPDVTQPSLTSAGSDADVLDIDGAGNPALVDVFGDTESMPDMPTFDAPEPDMDEDHSEAGDRRRQASW